MVMMVTVSADQLLPFTVNKISTETDDDLLQVATQLKYMKYTQVISESINLSFACQLNFENEVSELQTSFHP